MRQKVLKSPIYDNSCRDQIMSFIHGESWQPFFFRELSSEDKHYKHRHIVIEYSGKLIAHCHICISIKHGDFAQFTFLEVNPAYRGNGLARKVYNKGMDILAEEKVKFVFLETSFQNPARKHIYLKDGFTDIFISPANDVAMLKSLGPPVEDYFAENCASGKKIDEYNIEYCDYALVDVILNIKLNQMPNKNKLPFNNYGKRGAYCLFRDIHLVNKIKAYACNDKIVNIELTGGA